MGEKYEYLKKVLDDSHYTVALCGSGILAETGCRTFQNQDYAYEIEQKYGRSPEDTIWIITVCAEQFACQIYTRRHSELSTISAKIGGEIK